MYNKTRSNGDYYAMNDKEMTQRIQDAASNLELLTLFPTLVMSKEAVPRLNGNWRLSSELTKARSHDLRV